VKVSGRTRLGITALSIGPSTSMSSENTRHNLSITFLFLSSEALLYSHYLLHSLIMQEIYLAFAVFTCPLPALSFLLLSPDLVVLCHVHLQRFTVLK